MAQPSLEELTAAATAADEPAFITVGDTKFGGVDPLGLRQINFDLMDEVFPGLNNVARHVRPFVVVAWAWRRAHQRAQALGMTVIKQGQLQDFVDRIEVLYVLSQVLRDKDADLPGGQYLAPWLQETEFKFGGAKWQQRRDARRYSTALSAAINYGPGLKMLGWVTPHPQHSAVMIPNPAAAPALDALEAQIAGVLDHEAFSAFGPVTVTRDEARAWAELWALDIVTADEARIMGELLLGSLAPVERRLGGQLMLSAAAHADSTNTDRLRAAMAGSPSDFTPPVPLLEIRDAWRRLQLRQLFRLSLEALFYWTVIHLDGPSRSSDSLVTGFLDEALLPAGTMKAEEWIQSLSSPVTGPTELITRIQLALEDPAAGDLARSIAAGLAFSLTEVPHRESHTEQPERLPLSRARKEAAARAGATVQEFVRHVLESWVDADWPMPARAEKSCCGCESSSTKADGPSLLAPRAVLRRAPRRTGCRPRSRSRANAACLLMKDKTLMDKSRQP